MNNSLRQMAGARREAETVEWRVWAPERDRIEIVLYGPDGETEVGRLPTERADGFFVGSSSLSAEDSSILYKLLVDGRGPFPDPLSRAQPFGVHGPSAVTDVRFDWSDESWSGIEMKDAVFYEVHVGTATAGGTFDSLIERLADIRDLGANVIELMPVASSPGTRNWGYDGVCLYAPAHVYGGPQALKRLVDTAHRLGLGVVLDVVYNHLGPDGNYLREFSERYFTEKYSTPWGPALNFDGEGAEQVRELVLANAEMWIADYHMDGLRLDATHAIFDSTPPSPRGSASGGTGRRHILAELAERARTAAGRRKVVVIAEDERNDVRLVQSSQDGGYGLDGVWADDFHHQMRRAFAGDDDGYYADFTGTAQDIAHTVEHGWFYEGQHSMHLDKARGTKADDADPASFVHCIQNHDQVGNRAIGDRLGRSIEPEAYRAMSALLLLSPYTPLLFMGQEWTADTPFLFFTDHAGDLGRAVTEGRRKEFTRFRSFAAEEIPDPQAISTFARSKLDWSERSRGLHAGMIAWYSRLLSIRKSHPALQSSRRGTFRCRAIDDDCIDLVRESSGSAVRTLVQMRGSAEIQLGSEWTVITTSDDVEYGGTGRTRPSDGVIPVSGPVAIILGT